MVIPDSRVSPTWFSISQRPALLLGILVCVGFVLRLGFMLATRSLDAPPTEDALEYHRLALSLLAGDGYSLDGQPVVNRAPAYPVMLALIYAVVGTQPAVARVVQALVIAALVPLLYFIGARGWSWSVGLLAAALFAVYPFSIFWGQYLITENLLVVLFVLLGALLVRPQEAGPLRLLSAGVVMALSLLTRPTALPVVIGLCVWLFATRVPSTEYRVPSTAQADAVLGTRYSVLRRAAALGLVIAGLAIGLSPWVARNYATYGQFIPLTAGAGSSGGGYVFWISNNALTSKPGEKWGRYVAPNLLPEYDEYSRMPNDPLLLDRKGYEYGLRFLANNPGEVPVLLLGKFLRFWNVFPGATLATRAIGALSLLLLPFFLVGLRETWRDLRHGGMPLAFIVGTLLVGLIFWADTRTRAPAEPYILLTSAIGAARILNSPQRRRGRREP
jgi:hypothetical protein